MRKGLLYLATGALFSVIGLLAQADSSHAAFHLMRIYGVMGGAAGDDLIQYVELRMTDAGQSVVSGHDICFYDATGAAYARYRFPANVSNGADEASILVGTAEFDTAWPNGTLGANFTFTGGMSGNTKAIQLFPTFPQDADVLHPIRAGAGRVAFGTDSETTPALMCQASFTMIDSVSYGGAGYTGATGIPPSPESPKPPNSSSLPTAGHSGLRLQGPICLNGGGSPCDSTPPINDGRDNSADYALGDVNLSFNHPRNNAGVSGPLVGLNANTATTESSTNYTFAASVADKTPGAARQLTTTIGVPLPGNINLANSVTFDPAATMTKSCNLDTNADTFADAFDGNADGDATGGGGEGDLTTGSCLRATDAVGTISDLATYGLLNNACTTAATIDYDLYAIPLPNNVLNPRASTNIAYTQQEGTLDRFHRWGTTPEVGQDYITTGGGTVVVDGNLDTKADANNVAFRNYPEYLLDLFDADGEGGAGNPLLPTAVYGGITRVAGSFDWPVYIAYFLPSVSPGWFPGPIGNATSSLGWGAVTIQRDPTENPANPSPISAYCASTSTTSLNATVEGITRATNPATGTRFNLAWLQSKRDLDNDGIESTLDTCPLARNTEGDPRQSGNDPDDDNIDSVCDPNPGTNDGDMFSDPGTWHNTLDNCPLVANSTQANTENSVGPSGWTAGYANDDGPLDDGMGDACESGSVSVTYNGISHSIPLSSTVANGRWQVRALVVPMCHGATDSDGDGYCPSEDAFPAVATRWSSWTTTMAIAAVLGSPASIGSAGSWDTDQGGGDPITGGDSLADRSFDSDWIETYIGTDARQACALTVGTADEPLDAWLYDVNGNAQATISDMLAVPMLNVVASTPALRRFDWNVDGFVALNDLLSMGTTLNSNCRVPTGVAPGPQ